MPDYSESTDVMVKLFIPKSLPDRSFTKLISDEQKRTGSALPINSLLVLNELKRNRRSSVNDIAQNIHVSEAKVRITVEKLVESGIIEGAGQGRGRHYTLSAKLYQSSDNISGYIRQKGIDKVRYPEMIIQYAKNNNGCITRREAASLLLISEDQAYRLLKGMASEHKLTPVGKGKAAHYELV